MSDELKSCPFCKCRKVKLVEYRLNCGAKVVV